jgi:hypothetical protein
MTEVPSDPKVNQEEISANGLRTLDRPSSPLHQQDWQGWTSFALVESHIQDQRLKHASQLDYLVS